MVKLDEIHYAGVVCPECDATLTAKVQVRALVSPELRESPPPGEALPEITVVLDARVISLDGCPHAETFDPEAF